MPMAQELLGEDTSTPYANFAFQIGVERVSSTFAPGEKVPAEIMGGFSEVSGLEAMMEHKVIKIGGQNYGPQLRAGPVTFGTVVLKRGIVESRHLWSWWSMFAGADGATDARPTLDNRAHVLIGLIGEVGGRRLVRLGWRLRYAMPIKFRVGDLSGKGSDVAIEELHLAHEGLEMKGVVT
jgi:phage tail-like protein